jgi:hypothetical protein
VTLGATHFKRRLTSDVEPISSSWSEFQTRLCPASVSACPLPAVGQLPVLRLPFFWREVRSPMIVSVDLAFRCLVSDLTVLLLPLELKLAAKMSRIYFTFSKNSPDSTLYNK